MLRTYVFEKHIATLIKRMHLLEWIPDTETSVLDFEHGLGECQPMANLWKGLFCTGTYFKS